MSLFVKFFSLFSDTGSVFAFGENKMGQLGLGNQTDAVPSPAQVQACCVGLGSSGLRIAMICEGQWRREPAFCQDARGCSLADRCCVVELVLAGAQNKFEV